MTSKSKKLLIISGCVTAVGLIILLSLGIYTKFDLKRLNSTAYSEKTYTVTESFSNISVETCDCDVEFVISETQDVEITFVSQGKKDSFSVKDDTLSVISKKEKSEGSVFTPSFDFRDGKADVVISVPNRSVDLLSLKTSGGNISLSEYFNITAKDVELESDGGSILFGSGASDKITVNCISGRTELVNSKCSAIDINAVSGEVSLTDVVTEADVNAAVKSGKLTVSNLECNNFIASADSGNMELSGIKSAVRIDIDNGSGKVKMDESDANIINIMNDSGSVNAEFLTDKIFTTKSSDGGKISIPDPKEDLAGKCVIETKSGNVRCSIAG